MVKYLTMKISMKEAYLQLSLKCLNQIQADLPIVSGGPRGLHVGGGIGVVPIPSVLHKWMLAAILLLPQQLMALLANSCIQFVVLCRLCNRE